MSFKCRKRKSSSRLWSLNGPRLATQVRVLFFKTVHVHQHTDIWDIYTRMRVINSDCEYLWEFSERILSLKMTPFLYFLSYSFVEALFRTTKKIHICRPFKIIENDLSNLISIDVGHLKIAWRPYLICMDTSCIKNLSM